MLEPATYLRLLEALQSEFAAGLREADPDLPVPTCGDWSVGDLADHLAGVHHWAAAMARDEQEQPRPVPLDLAGEYAERAAALHTTLTDLGPEAGGRILNGLTDDGRGPASFWYRRQVHETLIHLVDLRHALGLPGPDVAPQVWADTVDEAVTVMYPRQVALGRATRVVTRLELTSTDTDRTWAIGAPNAVQQVSVSGPASGLALLLWRRATPETAGLAVTGDRAALDETLGRPIVP